MLTEPCVVNQPANPSPNLPDGALIQNVVKRKYVVLAQVKDVFGDIWDVRQIRPTKHGFDLLYGSPEPGSQKYWGGPPRLIAHQPLVDYWETNQATIRMIYDLPGGRTTFKRLRHHLGFNYHRDLNTFYMQRIDDLEHLTTRQFAARHNVDYNVASDARRKLLGRFARPLGWWRKARPLKILQSGILLRQIAEKLGISTSQAHRLRERARALALEPVKPPRVRGVCATRPPSQPK